MNHTNGDSQRGLGQEASLIQLFLQKSVLLLLPTPSPRPPQPSSHFLFPFCLWFPSGTFLRGIEGERSNMLQIPRLCLRENLEVAQERKSKKIALWL